MPRQFSFLKIVRSYVNSCSSDIFVKIIIEPIILPLTWVVLNFTSIRANTLTWIGLIAGLTGSLLCGLTLNLSWLLAGFTVFYILDFVDGPVANAYIKGGTYFGTRLDFVTDRSVLLSAILALGWYHYCLNDIRALSLLMLYYSSFVFLDLLAFGALKAKVRFDKHETVAIQNRTKNYFQSFQDPWVFIPSRLSSYFLGIIAYWLTREFFIAYIVALAGIFGDYLRAFSSPIRIIIARCIK